MSRHALLVLAAAAAALLAAAPARAAVSAPKPIAPAAGAVLQVPPVLIWTRVKQAEKYEVEIAGAGMNAPALAGQSDFYTRNTRATVTKTIADGSHAWRVRALRADGAISAWTAWRPFQKKWTVRPLLQTPSSGHTLTLPCRPHRAQVSRVPGAAQYLVSVATDPLLSSLVFHYQNQDDRTARRTSRRLRPRLTLSVFGTARRGVRGKLIVSAYAAGQPLRRVLLRLSGPGVVPRAKRTGAYGRVTFTLRPRRSGKLLFTATKRGYQREFYALAVQ